MRGSKFGRFWGRGSFGLDGGRWTSKAQDTTSHDLSPQFLTVRKNEEYQLESKRAASGQGADLVFNH